MRKKWVLFKETDEFLLYIPYRLYKKAERRAKRGKSTTVRNLKNIRIAAKYPEKISTMLNEYEQLINSDVKNGGVVHINRETAESNH